MRTDTDKIKELIDVDEDIDLTPFMEMANQIVDERCLTSNYSDARLLKIETLLAAHFYTLRDPRANSENAGGVGASYQGQTGKYFESSIYGQQAIAMDTAGNLAALQAAIEAGGALPPTLTWLGDDCEDSGSRSFFL